MFSRRRSLGLRRRQLTQNWSEGQWQWRRPWRRDLSLRERAMFCSTSMSLRVASFFQRGPTGVLSRRPFRKSLISATIRSEEHTSELQSHHDLVCRLLLVKKKHALLRRGPAVEVCVNSATPCEPHHRHFVL